MTSRNDTYPMSKAEAEEFVASVQSDLWPQLRRAMYGVAAISALVGAGTALVLLSIIAAAR